MAPVIEPDLQTLPIRDQAWAPVTGTGLEYAKVNDHDAYSVRDHDPGNGGEIRRPADEWRILGSIL
ncbi:hypothetical protein AB0K12_23810 [Nonomuraea sp. NPDC049419]|uniref:hypothetical protein n=1 Tax=Nonomuraea sp. NPDC049419 TaxID=3155772 RepID=UPI00341BBF84